MQIILRRLLAVAPTLMVVSVWTFLLIPMMPNDAAERRIAELNLTGTDREVAYEAARDDLGLNESLLDQFTSWMGGVVRGDLGNSWESGVSVGDRVFARLEVTVSIALAGALVMVVLGVAIGVLAASKQNGLTDRTVTAWSSVMLSTPDFVIALILAIVFGVKLGWFPATGYTFIGDSFSGWLRSITLPALALGLPGAGVAARHMRASMCAELQKEYVRNARARGVRGWRVLSRHALRNALVPVISVMSFKAAYLFGGALVVEQVFAVPGFGSLVVAAIQSRDVPMIQAVVLITALCVLVVNMAADLLHGWIDPRVRVA